MWSENAAAGLMMTTPGFLSLSYLLSPAARRDRTTRNWRPASTAAGPTASNMQYMYKFIAPVLQFSRVMNNYLNVD